MMTMAVSGTLFDATPLERRSYGNLNTVGISAWHWM